MNTPIESPNESYYLFRTNTTGLIRNKKMKAISSYEDALSAGRALNIIDGTPDRVFLIIPASSMRCHTNITEPLEFSEAFFRLPRLSDSNTKFQNRHNLPRTNTDDFDLTEATEEQRMLYVGSQINELHPALTVNTSAMKDKPIHTILSEAGLNRSNVIKIQALIQYELGIAIMRPAPATTEELRIIETLKVCFDSKLNEINAYISTLVMGRFASFESSPTSLIIPFKSSN